MKRKSSITIIFSMLMLIVTTGVASAQSVIDQHFKAINDHNLNAVSATYSPDAQILSPNWEGAKTGADGINEVYSRYFKSTPDLAYTVSNVINNGNNVVVEYAFSGTLSSPESGTPDYMKGKKYTINGCAIFVLKDNKISKETDYFDQVAFLKQVGFFDQNH